MLHNKKTIRRRKGISEIDQDKMPDVRSNPDTRGKVIAICTSDWHLCLRPPLARASESDWFEAMKRPIREIKILQNKYKCPIILAGDLFDRWNAPAELINFALANLPGNLYALPGQHDLPFHRYEDIHKSAFWTMVEAGNIHLIEPKIPTVIGRDGLVVHGWPWGYTLKPRGKRGDVHVATMHLAVAHAYIFNKESYPGADPAQSTTGYKKQLAGYDAAVFGDNHIPFTAKVGTCQVVNCGGFMRRKSDEEYHRPSVWLLYENARFARVILNSEGEQFNRADVAEMETRALDLTGFLEDLGSLSSSTLDFNEAVRVFLKGNKVSPEAKQILLQALESKE